MLISFLNDLDIQQILEFKLNFGKYNPVCPKNPQRVLIRTPHTLYIYIKNFWYLTRNLKPLI